MMNPEDQGDLPDKMGLTTTLGGYAMCVVIVVLMFWLALPAYN